MTSLELPGAVPPPDALDSGVAWHYGMPFVEQRRLAAGDAVVDLSHLGVVTVLGPDRLSWLHDLTTAFVRDLQPGESKLALILDHNGRVEMELHLIDDGSKSWLIVEASVVAPLIKYLESMRFLLRVDVSDASAEMAVVGVSGTTDLPPDGLRWRVPPEFSGTGSTPAGEDAGGGAAKYVPRRPGRFSIDQQLIPRPELTAFLSNATSLAGTWALEAERVGAGVPRVSVDADSRTLPHELGLIGPGVHLDKGCYRGQETVARTHNMGRPPRRLVQLIFDDSDDLPIPGSDVFAAGRRVGRLGSVVNHADLGPIGLALVKRNVDPDSILQVAAHDVGQVPIVVAQ